MRYCNNRECGGPLNIDGVCIVCYQPSIKPAFVQADGTATLDGSRQDVSRGGTFESYRDEVSYPHAHLTTG